MRADKIKETPFIYWNRFLLIEKVETQLSATFTNGRTTADQPPMVFDQVLNIAEEKKTISLRLGSGIPGSNFGFQQRQLKGA